MIKIEIAANAVRTITSKKSGQQYRVCEGYAHTIDPRSGQPHAHPTRCEFFLNEDQPTPPAGVYLLAPASVYVDRSGRLAVAPKLVPAPK